MLGANKAGRAAEVTEGQDDRYRDPVCLWGYHGGEAY